MFPYRTITNYESESNRSSDNTSPGSSNSDPHSLNSIEELERGEAVKPSIQSLPPDVSKYRKRKHESSVDTREKSDHIDMLTKYITKEQTEIEAWCTSLSLTLTKLPDYVQAEIKLSIANLVGQKELDYLKSKSYRNPVVIIDSQSHNDFNCAASHVTNEYHDNSYRNHTENSVSMSHNDLHFANPNVANDYNNDKILHDSFVGDTVIVHSKYSDSYATLTQL